MVAVVVVVAVVAIGSSGSSIRAGGMSSQLVQPNSWVADNFMNIEILFLPLIL